MAFLKTALVFIAVVLIISVVSEFLVKPMVGRLASFLFSLLCGGFLGSFLFNIYDYFNDKSTNKD